MAAGGHVALVGLGLGDIDDVVKEVGFAVLAAEVLNQSARELKSG
jgi:putative NIF3 family GTP cyclohydrolase 1 type 2